MKRYLAFFAAALLLFAGCKPQNPDPKPGPDPVIPIEEVKSSGITYQLLVYSFCDSNGDGIGDFAGITSKLDYLKSLGASALWLSPIHPASSYHGYDVLDYSSVNPEYGTEADLKNLIEKAHSNGIKIYLDYVLNHTSKDHPWFLDAKSSEKSAYRSFYFFSTTQKSGYHPTVSSENPGKVNVKFTLKCGSDDKPLTLKAEQVETIENVGTPTSGKYLWYGSVTEANMPQFYSTGSKTYTLSLALETDWGVLVRTSKTEWGASKYGAASESANILAWGKELNLKSNSDYDILMPWMENLYYFSYFGDGAMPDLNYGPATSCETSPAFKAVTEAADKWIELGIDGFRLDAIKHIYDNPNSDENPTFLKKFYDHCNSTWKAKGGEGEFYMVGEQFSEANEVAPYYKGLPAFFEFAFWWRLKDAINNGNGSNFVGQIQSYQKLYAQYRSNYIEATKLSNHDEDRAGSDLMRSTDKMKLAGAVLLSCSGQPYIYQGEELGYWGTKANGDLFVRTPMKWTKGGKVADEKFGGSIDKSMLSDAISVEAQEETKGSVLKVYESFGQARAKHPALAYGDLIYCSNASQVPQVSAWFRQGGGEKLLVVHNFGGSPASVDFSNAKLDVQICSNGTVTVKDGKLTLGPYSSVIFAQ